ncbi:unnamed protein product [Heligmosomoides polygyrus]|uniref:Uncharacterized protein n=1 Tax=Heligmosomoides polygyrus TaxID=6339 RepID=A0A183FPK0_HELPZ|nr:unnamed protein product [Heligmosomoides polygyrus]
MQQRQPINSYDHYAKSQSTCSTRKKFKEDLRSFMMILLNMNTAEIDTMKSAHSNCKTKQTQTALTCTGHREQSNLCSPSDKAKYESRPPLADLPSQIKAGDSGKESFEENPRNTKRIDDLTTSKTNQFMEIEHAEELISVQQPTPKHLDFTDENSIDER